MEAVASTDKHFLMRSGRRKIRVCGDKAVRLAQIGGADVLTKSCGGLMGTLVLLLVSVTVGMLVCKVVHEFGHALTALVFGSKIESVSVNVSLKPGFIHITYQEPAVTWQRGLTALMGTISTTALGYGLVFVVLLVRPACWLRLGMLSISCVCAWDMFLYATLPLFGLRRGLIAGGRHAEPVCGAEMMGIPRWLFLFGLVIGFVLFHTLLYYSLRRNS